jgi:membrane protein DedA with SNARE-associated domain
MDTVASWLAEYGYAAIFGLLVLGIVGIPVPDESLLTLAGYLVRKGELHAVPAVLAAFLGSACGITISYAAGRTAGLLLVRRYGHLVHVTPAELDRIGRWFDRFGRWCLPVGYFVPGVRHATAFVAGTSGLSYPVFAAFAYAGGFVWSVTFVSLGYAFGEEGARFLTPVLHHLGLATALALAVLAVYAVARRWRRRAGG